MYGNTDKAKRYASSLTKFTAASYQVPQLELQMARIYAKATSKYNDETALGIFNWPEMRKWFYKWKWTCTSTEKVFSKQRILAITSIPETEKRYGYNFLKKIVVRRQDDELYSFSEADYRRLNIHDIKDMYLLKIQGKTLNLPRKIQYDLINSILLFIRGIVLRARVEDVQLGAESYQTRLNITAPRLEVPEFSKLGLYQFNRKPFGLKYNYSGYHRFMGYEEIHKFGDHTLLLVKDELDKRIKDYDRGLNVGWTKHDLREALKFVLKIDKRLQFRDQMRRLESYVGGRAPVPNILTYSRPNHPTP